MSAETESVLHFEAVDLLQTRSADSALREVELRVGPGELALIQVRRGLLEIPLGDAVCGMMRPDKGVVRFDGLDWTAMSPREAQRKRHDIGRFHGDAPWISNLNIDENILLGECHHTRRDEAEILAEALALAARFGLEEITSKRPHLISQRLSAVYQLVRAFLGKPKLIYLERPMRGVVSEFSEVLIELLGEYRAEGGAVVWISSEQDVLDSTALNATSRYAVEPPHLRAQENTRA